ncbi:hypothetical protein [Nonomuraea candida]|uniref:hypothetical protein n=1 Tax=Nonomuraea candida TaxID=359159 RepID=UPI0005B7AD26|nr:hypothetical protein [Nonomuraea candida]
MRVSPPPAGVPADARTHLRTAHDSFTALGMRAFADRADHELLATGETVRKPAAGTPDQGHDRP